MHDCAATDAEVASLRARVAELEELVRKLSVPDFVKPDRNAESRRRKRKQARGAREGHEAKNRPTPEVVDEVVEATAKKCPDCNDALGAPVEVRERVIETVVPGHVVTKRLREARYRCKCGMRVQARAPDALPGERFGVQVMLLVAYYASDGMSFRKIQRALETAYGLRISLGALEGLRTRLAEALGPRYERLRLELQASRSVNADETSWPIDGENHWLWTFTTPDIAYFTVRRSRGANVVLDTLEDYGGVLGSDFWAAYNTPFYRKQKCLVHLQRELREVSDRRKTPKDAEWWAFRKKLVRVVHDGVRARERITNPETRALAADRFDARVRALANASYADKDAARIAKLLRKHDGELFTFLREEGIDSNNNRAERGLRPSVVTRKTSFGSRSTTGADATAVLQSVIHTARLRGQNFLHTAPAMLGIQATAPEG